MMVMEIKQGRVTEDEYTEMYLQILDRVSYDTWRKLYELGLNTGFVTLLCYCRDGWLCHTHILIRYATHHFPHLFRKMS